MPILELTPARRAELRAAAHVLRPVVLIGDRGLSDTVLAEIDRSLKAHELIKVRAASADRDEREAMLAQLADQLDCAPVHHLGRMLVLFRPKSASDAVASARTAQVAGRDAFVPKKLAAAGRTAADAPRRRSVRPDPAQDLNAGSARERYLGRDTGRAPRPTTGSRGSARGAARTARPGAMRSALSLKAGVARRRSSGGSR